MNRFKSIAVSLTLFLLLACAMEALADNKTVIPGDQNKDGTVSCSEANSQTDNRFKKMDANKDKSLTKGEFDAGTKKNFDAAIHDS